MARSPQAHPPAIEILPTEWCCCCVPSCFGLRGGVMAIAAVQTIIGGVYFLVALGSFVGMIAEGSTESSLGQNAASFVLYLLASSLWITIGVLGLIATWDLQAIVNLAHQASAQAERYYKANLFGFAVIVFLTVIGIIMSTVSVVAGKIIVDGQVVQRNTSQQILAVIWVWLVAVFSLAVQAYFLYVGHPWYP
eukprot:jgi/Tetstr1/448956/TSEL_036181.t2